MADSLGLLLGDVITLMSPDGDVTPLGTTPRVKGYPIVAVFEVGMSEFDSSIIFMPFGEAQLYFNLEGRAQTIEVFVDDPDAVEQLKEPVETAAKRQIFLSDWRQRNQTFFSALQVERNVMFMILTLIVLVAALNIISGLIMLVKDKGHDIAILRTMGASRGAIFGFPDDRRCHRRDGDRRRGSARDLHLPQRRIDPAVLFLDIGGGIVQSGTLFPQPAAREDGPWAKRFPSY